MASSSGSATTDISSASLFNQPYCTDELGPGAVVRFGPEHVIQIQHANAA
ncbi:MAG: hypothetical protein LBI76_15560 [Comamonas sp.]|jgi:hypothetical protein|nr:hypothetical protein [Comamonas sp.]